MSNETNRLQMPLLQPAQAQKHVTVNDALMRLDGLVNLVLESLSVATPPVTVTEGQCWGVPALPKGAWIGQAGMVAIGCNGGWNFAKPNIGMRAFIKDLGVNALYDGQGWSAGSLSLGVGGSGLMVGMAEGDITLSSATTLTSTVTIPAGVLVIGAVAKVKTAITGTLTSWRLGTNGATNRFGQGLGKAVGSYSRGMLGAPMAYYQADPLIVTADGGTFTAGQIRLAVHWLDMRLPT